MQSEQVNELMGALAKAQGQMSGAKKDSSNPHFKSRYADLASVWDACREPLSSHGLAVVQSVCQDGERQMIVTTLGHTSGQWMKSSIVLPMQKPGAQEFGSCMSYCRRYGLAAMVGVYQDDDDGERAVAPSRDKFLNPQMVAAMAPYFSEDEEAVKMVLSRFSIDSWAKVPFDKFGEVMAWLRTRKAQREVENDA